MASKSHVMILIYLLASFFGISCGATWIIFGFVDFELSGKIALAGTMATTGLFHFIWTKGMILMMPAFLPAKKMLVYITGILEILVAPGLLIPVTTRITAILLIIFLVLILPSNIEGARKKVNLSKGDFTGPGLNYLWQRIPIQLVLIGWTYWFCLR